MRVMRLLALGAGVVLAGAALGFVASLLRPRRYADLAPADRTPRSGRGDGAALGEG